MKVLLLTQVLPYPLDSGPKIKTFYLLKYLSESNEVTLVSFVRGDQTRDIEKLNQYCARILTIPMHRGPWENSIAFLRSLWTGLPWMIVRDDVKAMRKLLVELVETESFDIVHADQLNMAQYAQKVPSKIKVVDEHNALWLLYKRLAQTMRPGIKRWLLNRDWKLIKDYEGKICREFDFVLAVSDEDRIALLEALGIEKEIQVIPISVDTNEISPVERKSTANHILHIGTMYWPPNVDGILWFTREVFPLIVSKRPDIVFDILGARPPKEILNLPSRYPGLNVTGYVEDPVPYYQQASLMVVPLRAGGGMRVKILNAMAQGIPIVSTTLGCEGIKVSHKEHIMIADCPDEFAEAVLMLLDHPDYAKKLALEGIKLVKQYYDYRSAYAPLEKIYNG